MGKDNKLLWIIAAVGAGWFLAPKEVKEQITEGMPSIGIDLSGLLGGGVGQAPLGLGGVIPEFNWPAFEFPTFPELPLLDTTGIIQGILDAGNTAAGVIGAAGAAAAAAAAGGGDKGGEPAPTPPPAPKGTWEWIMEEFTGLHPVVKNVVAVTAGGVAGVATVGGTYAVIKGVQAVAPAARITTDAMARTFAAVLRGKKPPISKLPIVKPSIPWWAKTPLGKQWLQKTTLGKGGTPMLAIGAIGDWLNNILFKPEPSQFAVTSEMMNPNVLYYGSGGIAGYKPDVSTVIKSERTYLNQPVPMRAERAVPQPLTLTQKYGKTETKKPLYKPPLEGVQW